MNKIEEVTKPQRRRSLKLAKKAKEDAEIEENQKEEGQGRWGRVGPDAPLMIIY